MIAKSTITYGQGAGVPTGTKPIGIIKASQKPIEAFQYIFSEDIFGVDLDTIDQQLSIKLRGLSKNKKYLNNTGTLMRLNTHEGFVMWSSKINYLNEDAPMFNGTMFRRGTGASVALDNNTGRKLWSVGSVITYATKYKDIALGLRSPAFSNGENILVGIDLKAGKEIWKRKMNLDYGVSGISYLNDSTLLVSASGLHSVSLKDGTGWDHEVKTGSKDFSGTILQSGLAILSASLTGYYYMPGGPTANGGLHSNVLLHKGDCYFASLREVVKLNTFNGQVKWRAELPASEGSSSILYERGDSIILVNLGYVKRGGKKHHIGKPFLASYNAVTGSLNFKTDVLAFDKEMQDFALLGNYATFTFNDRVAKYDVNDGKLSAGEQIDTASVGGRFGLIGKQTFIKRGDDYIRLVGSGPKDDIHVYTEDGKALILNKSLKVKEVLPTDTFYVKYMQKGRLNFIRRKGESIVIDGSGKELARFDAAHDPVWIDKKLYISKDNILSVIDMSELLSDADVK